MSTVVEPSPDLTMAELAANPLLRRYLDNVRSWHGYIRFLGLPDRRDNRDVIIDRLFVEPLLTQRYVSPDENPLDWIDDAETVFEALRSSHKLVVLGDPGSGKSTLLNYLVWLLARPTTSRTVARIGGWRLPVPMVLRELQLRGISAFDDLLGAFLAHDMSRPLRARNAEYLHSMLERGRVFFLLDGIDEIGDTIARQSLRQAVLEGFGSYGGCRWVLSSRIVGYDEAPFDDQLPLGEDRVPLASAAGHRKHLPPITIQKDLFAPVSSDSDTSRSHVRDQPAVTRYVAPFDDRRIRKFARRWYIQREAAAARAGKDAQHLVNAVHADDAILRLARIPNLLTLMALIHRVEASLPHGRALLYERIAEAYLESIDKSRGFASGAYNLAEKKRWLARVGYEMQKRRSAGNGNIDEESSVADEAALLADGAEVVNWLRDEMGRGASGGWSPREFLDFVGRRSGLFVPRSEGRYAFVHLSFQEYFAAIALEREVTGFSWARGKRTELGLDGDTVLSWAGAGVWRETFAFLVELLADRPDWHSALLDSMFGQQYVYVKDRGEPDATGRAQLLARIAVNQRSGLGEMARMAAIRAAVESALVRQSEPEYAEVATVPVLGELLRVGWHATSDVLEIVVEEAERLDRCWLLLSGTPVSDVSQLAKLKELTSLDLRETRVVNVEPLAALKKLRVLILWDTMVADITPVGNLSELRVLDLMGTMVSSIEGLRACRKLRLLDLRWTSVGNMEWCEALESLESLYLKGTEVRDLAWLRGCTHLKDLDVGRTEVGNIRPLEHCGNLRSLYLSGTKVKDVDLEMISGLKELRELNLEDTNISRVGALAECTALRWVNVSGTGVSRRDIRALREALPDCNVFSRRISAR